MKTEQAKTLSEAFLAVREFLWDGTCPFEDVFPDKEGYICFAVTKAKHAKRITPEQSNIIKDTIQDRLEPYSSVTKYVTKVYGAVNPKKSTIQEYRHAWLIHLAQEAENGKSNP